MKVQNNSWRRSRRFLRVAASSNTSLNLTLCVGASRLVARRLALRSAGPC